MNEYVNEHYNNILRIKSTTDARTAGVDSLVAPEVTPKGQLVARYETDTQKLFLVPAPFRKWCGARQINYNAFVEDLTRKLGASIESIRLGKGTLFKMNSMKVLVIPFREEIGSANETRGSEDF